MIACRSAGTRLYQPARYSARCSFKDIVRLRLARLLAKRTVDQAAFSNSCTFGHGSGARLLNGAQSASLMRSKIAALTDGRARIRAHHSATAGERSHMPASLSSVSRRTSGITAQSALEQFSPARYAPLLSASALHDKSFR